MAEIVEPDGIPTLKLGGFGVELGVYVAREFASGTNRRDAVSKSGDNVEIVTFE